MWGCIGVISCGSVEVQLCERFLRKAGGWRDSAAASLGSWKQIHWTSWDMEKIWKVWTWGGGRDREKGSLEKDMSHHGEENPNRRGIMMQEFGSAFHWGLGVSRFGHPRAGVSDTIVLINSVSYYFIRNEGPAYCIGLSSMNTWAWSTPMNWVSNEIKPIRWQGC